jgi:hypothetical protein
LIILHHHVDWWLFIGGSIWIIIHSIPDSLPLSALLSLKCHLDTFAALVVGEIVESFKFGRNLEPLLTFKTKSFLDLVLLADSHGCGNSERTIIAECSLLFTTVLDHNCERVVVNLAIGAARVGSLESKLELITLRFVVHDSVMTFVLQCLGDGLICVSSCVLEYVEPMLLGQLPGDCHGCFVERSL